MRFESKSLPHPANRHVGDSRFIGHSSGRPIGRPFRFCFKDFIDQFGHLFVVNSMRAICSEFIMQSFKTSFHSIAFAIFQPRSATSQLLHLICLLSTPLAANRIILKRLLSPLGIERECTFGFKLIAFLLCQFDNRRSAPAFSHLIPPLPSLCN